MSNLTNKHILVFAATGAIAGQAAEKFAVEGAHVWISARDGNRLQALRDQIRSNGGTVNCDEVDATDPQAVADYVSRVKTQAGRIDGVFNGIGGRPESLGYPAVSADQPIEDFLIPFNTIVASQFLTAREGAKHIQGGAIVFLTASLAVMTQPYMAGISAAQGAIESLTRSLAGEYGPQGIRVNCVRGSGMPETTTIQETAAGYAELGLAIEMKLPPLGRPISVADTVGTATYLLSDLSSGVTGRVIDVSAGAFV